jgi:phage/plasmid-like protein (TIGR03299 family)
MIMTSTMQETVTSISVAVEGNLPWSDVTMGAANGRVLTSQELLMEGSLDWDVDIRPLYRRMRDTSIVEHPRAKEVYRTDTEVSLGVVRGHYRPWPNREAFSPWDALVASGEGTWEECGAQRNGSRVFMTMKLRDGLTILGEDYHYYLFVGVGHDGYVAINPSMIPIRIAGLTHSAVGTNSIRVQHTPSLETKKAEVRQVQELARGYAATFAEAMTKLAETTITEDRAASLLERAINPKKTRRSELVEEIMGVYRTSPTVGQGTGYGLFNALTQWQCHHRKHRRGNARFDSLMWGDDAQTRQRFVTAI